MNLFSSMLAGFAPKIGVLFLAAVCFGVFGLSANAQTLLVNYDFATAIAGTPCSATPLNTATGVVSTFTTGGTGGGTCTTPTGTAAASPPAFTANASNQSVSLTSFADGSTNFFQFQLSTTNNYQDYKLFFQLQRSNTGPTFANVQYSLDGTNFTTFVNVDPANGSFAAFIIDLSEVSAIEGQPNVYFRILGAGGTNAAGTFRMDNFQVQAVSPLAAGAIVGGRVRSANGRGIGRVTVTLSGGALAEPMRVITSPFGYYRFDDVPAGQSYIISVAAKRYFFANPTRVVTVLDELAGEDFVADQ